MTFLRTCSFLALMMMSATIYGLQASFIQDDVLFVSGNGNIADVSSLTKVDFLVSENKSLLWLWDGSTRTPLNAPLSASTPNILWTMLPSAYLDVFVSDNYKSVLSFAEDRNIATSVSTEGNDGGNLFWFETYFSPNNTLNTLILAGLNSQTGVTKSILTLSAAEQVGIGTTQPGRTVDVVGGVVLTGLLRGNTTYPAFRFSTDRIYLDYNTSAATTRVLRFFRHGNAVTNTPTEILSYTFISGQSKTFIIQHPKKPDHHLVHAAIEGPESRVFYTGKVSLRNGEAKVTLPKYFEALTRQAGRRVFLTVEDSFDRVAVKSQDGEKVKDGVLHIYSNNADSTATVHWEVQAVRADIATLDPEPLKSGKIVAGRGPYRYFIDFENPEDVAAMLAPKQSLWNRLTSLFK